MKGIVLAGGKGTRLYPITKAVSKQLLPIYDKPIIYYSLSTLLLAGIRDILLISTPEDIGDYELLLGNGEQIGVNISYAVQEKPKGIGEAFLIGEKFIGTEKVCLILGDNFFYGQGFVEQLKKAREADNGAVIFGYYVKNPKDFGVVNFDSNNRVVAIEEKPLEPKSNYAVPGLYFYDNKVITIAKQIKPSDRGELEITSINQKYLELGELKVEILSRGMAWLDTGTTEGLLEASNFVSGIQNRQGLYIGCLEEISYRIGNINKNKLSKLICELSNTDYGNYLKKIYNECEG